MPVQCLCAYREHMIHILHYDELSKVFKARYVFLFYYFNSLPTIVSCVVVGACVRVCVWVCVCVCVCAYSIFSNRRWSICLVTHSFRPGSYSRYFYITLYGLSFVNKVLKIRTSIMFETCF